MTPQPSVPPSASRSRSRSSLSRGVPSFPSRVMWSVMLLLCVSVCVPVPSLVSAQTQKPDCILTIPDVPLSIAGLATPWFLSNNPASTIVNPSPCTQTNPAAMTFVQGAILNQQTGAISIYDPLVLDLAPAGKQPNKPLFPNVVPTINANAGIAVAIWIQTNANSITLSNNAGVVAGKCTNGIQTVLFGPGHFGKIAFCGVVDFFTQARGFIGSGQLVPPALGVGTIDGQACPSIRDYSFVGIDTIGTVTTSYLLDMNKGLTAHNTPQNNQLCNGACVVIQSDSSRTLTSIYQAIGCSFWTTTDLTDRGGQQATALPLNELQAFVNTANNKIPSNMIALVPPNHPAATVGTLVNGIPNTANGIPNLQKLNLLRDALNQPQVATLAAADTVQYCTSLTMIPPPRLAADANILRGFIRQGNADEANSLYTLVVKRQIQLYTSLGCVNLVAPVPFTVVPPEWTPDSRNLVLLDANPIQPPANGNLRCQNMFILDTKCSFLVALLVVGGGIVLGFIGLLMLRVLQAWKYGDKAKQDSTRAAIRV